MRHNQEDLCWQSDDSSVTKASVSVSWVFNALNCPFIIMFFWELCLLASSKCFIHDIDTQQSEYWHFMIFMSILYAGQQGTIKNLLHVLLD